MKYIRDYFIKLGFRMPGVYTVKVMVEFAAAHKLRGYVGDCARLHGHNWKVEAEVVARGLNEIGIAFDFRLLREALKGVADSLDHQYINELPPCDTINPTAENLACWFYQKLLPMTKDSNLTLNNVRIWETDRCSVIYSEE